MLARALAWSTGDMIEEPELRDALMLDRPRAGKRDVPRRPLGGGFSLQGALDEAERHYLERAQLEADGVRRKAAELLGVVNYQTYDNWRRGYLDDA